VVNADRAPVFITIRGPQAIPAGLEARPAREIIGGRIPPSALEAHRSYPEQEMTKVQIDFHLQHPLDDELMTRIAGAYSIYGIQKITLAPSQDRLTVEYDATRLRSAEVHAALTRAGIPAAPK